MKDHHHKSTLSTSSNTKSASTKHSRTNLLEIYYNENLKEYLQVTEFKEFKFNQKQEYAKTDDSDINILCIEDVDLRDMLKGKEFPEKDFNIVNSFLKIEEEEFVNMNDNNLNSKNTLDGNDVKIKNKNNEIEEEDSTLSQINSKLFTDDEFQPGLFTSFDFKDRIKSIINNSLNMNNNMHVNLFNKINNDKDSTESNYGTEELKLQSKIDDSFILDTCFTDKNITYDNIVINFDEEVKKEKKETSISEDRKLDFEYFPKVEAIPEYENQIISYQYLNHIEKQKSIDIFPEQDETFNRKLFEYFIKVSKEIKDDGLKNKVKLLLKLILYKDPKSKRYIFTHKVKNQLLNYWKNQYEKELNEATFREKSKILQQKFESVNPNNKVVELSKKLAENKRRANLKKNNRLNNNLFNSVRNGAKSYSKFNSKNYGVNKSYIRRFSTGVKVSK